MLKSASNIRNTKNELIFFSSIFFTIVIFLLISFNLYSLEQSQKVLGTKMETKEDLFQKDSRYWKEFLTQHPTYFPGWIELTKYYLSTGNISQAKGVLNKARSIDPNSNEVFNLEAQLN